MLCCEWFVYYFPFALIEANVSVLPRFTNYSIKESTVSDVLLCSAVKLHGVVMNFSNHQSYKLVRYNTCIESRLGLVFELLLEFQSHVTKLMYV